MYRHTTTACSDPHAHAHMHMCMHMLHAHAHVHVHVTLGGFLAHAGVVLAAALRLDAVVHAHLLALSTPASKGWSRGEEVSLG